MSTKLSGVLAVGLLTCGLPASAAVIDFTGGTVTGLDATTVVTDNNVLAWNVDYYEVGNDVAHAHWATGDYGGVESIEISKIGGGSFDLNYFILTSTTDTGGAPASGLEEAWVEGFLQGVSTGAAVQLPSEDQGFPASQIFLGSAFDNVDLVRFFVTNAVDCFGMDEFYIDQAAPGVPEPGTLALLGLGLGFAGLGAGRRRKQH